MASCSPFGKNMDIKNKLLELLICPECKQKLTVEEHGAVCENCRLLYPFSSGGLAMQADSAISLKSKADEMTN